MNWDLVVIFTFVIVLTAVRSHYRRGAPAGQGGLGLGDQTALDRAMDTARRLEQRVDTLERLLDEDAPGWRARARA
jgi:phage shock protein B